MSGAKTKPTRTITNVSHPHKGASVSRMTSVVEVGISSSPGPWPEKLARDVLYSYFLMDLGPGDNGKAENQPVSSKKLAF